MITIKVTYPNGQSVIRRLYPSQAQMIINDSRKAGAIVEVIDNPTNDVIT